ncbi:hypothetical protein [Pseudarthrobacter sp. B4EP4b]|uniref:hypothetical protein n=1 Tax=Pseudarthrobacter sp. B4EP4b TaxID=2590664 RepID=UPI00114E8F4D|nr:hypothetical protein [Pseudarthrobacter sp. B4EP4b]
MASVAGCVNEAPAMLRKVVASSLRRRVAGVQEREAKCTSRPAFLFRFPACTTLGLLRRAGSGAGG